MANVRKVRPGELLLLADGTSVENKERFTVKLVRLTKEETEKKIKQSSKYGNLKNETDSEPRN